MDSQPEQKSSGTYDEIKEAARRSGGDPAKEWFTGPVSSGSTIYKAIKSEKEEIYVRMKRGLEEGATWKDSLHDHR